MAGSRRSPTSCSATRPVLSVEYAGALLAGGQLEGVEARLRDAERWLDTTADGAMTRLGSLAARLEMIVVDEEEFRRLPGSIAIYRAAHALALGNVPETVTYARRALDLAPEDDHLLRGAAAATPGACLLDERGSRGSAPDVCRRHGSSAEGREHL